MSVAPIRGEVLSAEEDISKVNVEAPAGADGTKEQGVDIASSIVLTTSSTL